jgi:hypothetical protein
MWQGKQLTNVYVSMPFFYSFDLPVLAASKAAAPADGGSAAAASAVDDSKQVGDLDQARGIGR